MAIDKSDYKRVFATVFTHAEELLLSAKRHPNALRQYLDSWQDIAEKAAEVDSLALQDVILLFVDASDSAFKNTLDLDSLTDAQWQLLTNWDRLFANYINSPDNQQAALALIQCLNDPVLMIGLESEDQQMLLEGFLPVIKQLQSHKKEEIVAETSAEASSANEIAPPISAWEKLTVLFDDADSALQELLARNTQSSDEVYAENVRYYLENWKVVAELIDSEHNETITKTFDIVSLLIEFSSQLFNQNGRLTSEQQELLQQWHNLFAKYIKIKGSQQLATALVRLLTHPAWPQPISKADEKMLLVEFEVIDKPELQLSSNNQVIVQKSGEHNDLLISSPLTDSSAVNSRFSQSAPDEAMAAQTTTIWKLLEKYFIAAVLNLETMDAEQRLHNKQTFTEHLQNYKQQWQHIAETIETDEQQAGLLDMVLVFTEITTPAFEQIGLNNQHLIRLKKWHDLFGCYLKGQGDSQFILPLIKCLSDSFWPAAITAEDEQLLLSNFNLSSPSLLEQSDIVTPESSPSVIAITEIVVAPKLHPQTVEDTNISTTTINNINEESVTSNHQSTVAKKLTIWQQLELLFKETTLNLKAAAEDQLQNDQQALKVSLQHYLESWLAMAQQIEINAELPGFLDVVLIFIEESRQTFAQLNNFDKRQITLLNKWQNLFNSYLKAKGNRQLAIALIKCLRDPLWEGAIMAEDEEMLLEGFASPSQSQPKVITESLADSSEVVSGTEQIVTATQTMSFKYDKTESIVESQTLEVIEASPEPALTEKTEPVSETTVQVTEKLIWLDIQPVFEQAKTALKAAVDSEIINDVAAFKRSLQEYVERWQVIADLVATDNSLSGFSDVILLFTEISNQTFIDLDSLSSEQFALLNHWQDLFEDFFTTQNKHQCASGLIKCLRNSSWSESIEVEDVAMLFDSLGIDDSHQIALPTEHSLDLIDDTAVETEKNPVWQKIAVLFDNLQRQLPIMQKLLVANDQQTCRDYLQQYAERWLVIAETIAKEEDSFQTFVDVTFLFADNCMELVQQNVTLNQLYLQLLQSWHTAFITYLQNVSASTQLNSLIECLEDSQWIRPLTAIDKEMLLAMQADESQQQSIIAANSENLLLFNDGLFAEDEGHNFALFTQDSANAEPVSVMAIEESTSEQEAQEIALFANETPQTNTNEDFAWIAQDSANAEPVSVMAIEESTSEQEAQEIALFADETPQTNTNEDFAWIAQDSANPEPVSVMAIEESTSEQEAQETALFADETPQTNTNEDFAWIAQDSANPEPVSVMAIEESTSEQEAQETALFADETPQTNTNEDFAWIAQDSANPEPVSVMAIEESTSEQEAQETALFADETPQTNTNEDFAWIAQDSANAEPVSVMATEESTSEQEAEKALRFTDEISETVDDLQPNTESESPTSDKNNKESAAQPAPVNPELIGMVRDEFALLVKEINTEINATLDAQTFKEVLKNHEFKFKNLAKACNTIGLLGLEQVFQQLSLNMRSRRDSDTYSERESELFKAALPLIQKYIAAITERDKAIALVAHLSMPGWKQPLTETQTEPLIKLLSALVVSSHNQQLDNRKTVAELADVSLELPGDVNSELLDSLLNELPVLTNNFSAVIQKIISNDRTLPQLLEAQRIAHTLKGSGNIVGVTGIAVLTHHLEEILEYLTKHETFPAKALAGVLLESADCLEMMSDLMLNGENQPPEQALQVLQNVLNWANQIATNGLPTEDSEVERTTLPEQPDTNITPIVKEFKSLELVAMTRVPNETIDKLLRMTGEGSILSEQFKERINRFSNELKLLNDLTWQMHSLVSELDQSINIQSYNSKTSRAGIDTEFDALEMEQYNELHTAASRIAEAATDIREINIHMDQQLLDLKYLMVEEDAIQKENQEMVQSIRMVPANTIASRCQRIVRQACRATNKEVDLEIKGADILIDSEILNDMVEPLMHLLRNSIDHGIEPLHIREKYNKPKTGKITLEFSRKGNYAVISCKDDGGGLASGNILQTAIKKGLISAKQQLTEAEIHKLILIPGFSTRTVVTQTSGRGIGMDAIQTKISAIQGQMSLFSARGEGLTIEITIPLTLSSMLSLLVKCGGQTMAISNRGLRKIHHADECTLIREDEQLYCDIELKRYSAKYFSELVGIPITYGAEQKLQALRIEDEIGRTYIVFVEELLGYRDLLVKNMGSYIPHIQGITGASILGNGAVAPVIDLVEMLHHSAKYDYLLADATKALADSINGLPVALVVDDSLSARRAVAMLLKDSGLEVETAIDGLDAIKQIDKAIPDIILVDLEMPRMNGIELTAHVRGRETMKNTPIIMITSRATEKHRKQAEAAGVTKFMTKPFTEDELINNVRALMK